MPHTGLITVPENVHTQPRYWNQYKTALENTPTLDDLQSPVSLQGVLDSTGGLPTGGNTTGDAYLVNGTVWVWDGSAWTNQGSLTTGPQGDAAALRIKGTKATTGDLPASGNVVNDVWVVDADSHGYAWTTDHEWVDIGELRGPTGPGGADPRLDVGDEGQAFEHGPSGPAWARREVNVMAYGAVADGTTNDYTAITAAAAVAITLGLTLYFPSGTYAVGTKLVPATGARWRLDPDAVITYTSAATKTQALIEVRSVGDIQIRGGQLLGTYDWATYGTNDTTGRIAGQNLFKIDPSAVSSGQTIADILVENVTAVNAGDNGFWEDTDANRTVERITYRDIKVLDSMNGVSLGGGTRSSTGGWMQHVTVDGLYVNNTHRPSTTTLDTGGNALTRTGVLDHLKLTRIQIDAAGRMSIELWEDSAAGIAWSQDVQITRSHFGQGLYRTFSVLARDLVVTECWIEDDDSYVELWAANVSFRGCTFVGTGFQGPNVGTSPTQFQKDYYCRSWSIVDNDFINPVVPGALYLQNTQDHEFSHNRIRVTAQLAAGISTSAIRRLVECINCANVKADDNTFIFSAPEWERRVVRFSSCQNWSFDDNDIIVNPLVTSVDQYDGAGASLFVPFTFEAITNGSAWGNTLSVSNALTIGSWVVDNTAGNASVVTRRKFSGTTTFADTACTVSGSSLNTPPGAPATNAIYLTGDAPTGLWATHPVAFATWGGAAWTFEPILDIFADHANSWTGSPYPGAPNRAVSGDVYALVRNVAIGNRIGNNKLDIAGKLTYSGGAIWTIGHGVTSGTAISWRNEWTANNFIPTDQASKCGISDDAIRETAGHVPRPLRATTLPPACPANRGKLRRIDAAAGVADQFVACAKDAANAYAWPTII